MKTSTANDARMGCRIVIRFLALCKFYDGVIEIKKMGITNLNKMSRTPNVKVFIKEYFNEFSIIFSIVGFCAATLILTVNGCSDNKLFHQITFDSIKCPEKSISSLLQNRMLYLKQTANSIKNDSTNYFKIHRETDFSKYLALQKPFADSLVAITKSYIAAQKEFPRY